MNFKTEETSLIPSDIEKETEIPKRIHEVFLSFRGKDTRISFISHLNNALQNAAINVFKDYDSMERGNIISDSLLQAIEDFEISVVVFSISYADSPWCLEELAKIMDWRRTRGKVVLPVFYHLDPFEVRHQIGEFGNTFQNLLKKIPEEEHNWLSGFVVLNSRNEIETIQDIVENVAHLLDKTGLLIANNLVEIECRVQDMIQLLDLDNQQSNDVLLLGMWGYGGIGKTTIAKAISNKIGRNFEGKCFLANIRKAWEQHGKQMQEHGKQVHSQERRLNRNTMHLVRKNHIKE